MQVKLSDVIDALSMTDDEVQYFYNVSSGEIEGNFDDDDEDDDEVNEIGEYIALPPSYEIDDY
mgnify:CR=1 FL=1|jgi:hypothetical protein